ncbi:helix-turn-helix transcriptional regulator [Streptomyces sp. NPDC051577]|uniref:helix-turn-helix domain-containing protein n=1 Tax=Streptomyces sp. NPDC051577 TaxID=3155166 RepID=UPI00343F7EED
MTQTRATPTVKRRRVGAQLRRYREAVDMKTGDAAKAMGWDNARMSRTERGLQRVSGDEVHALGRVYGVDDEAALAEIARVAEEPPDIGWWMPYRGLMTQEYIDFITLESEAETIRIWHAGLVGGLLQTPAYAREIAATSVTPMSLEMSERLVAARMARQEVFSRPGKPVHYSALVPEAAFHQRFVSGPSVLRDQLTRLLDASEAPHISIRVVPLTALPHPGTGGNFTLLTFGHPWNPVVSVDHNRGGSTLEDPAEVAVFEAMYDRIEDAAFAEDASRDVITTYLKGTRT